MRPGMPQVVCLFCVFAVAPACVTVLPAPPCSPGTLQSTHGQHGVAGFRLEMSRPEAEAWCERRRGEWDDGWCELAAGGQRLRVRADREIDPPLAVRPSRFAGVARVREQLEQELRDALGPPWRGSTPVQTLYPLSRPNRQQASPVEAACMLTVESPAIAVRSAEGGGFDVAWSRVSWQVPGAPEQCAQPLGGGLPPPPRRSEEAPVDLRVGVGLGAQGSAADLAGPAVAISAEVSRPLVDWLEVGARAAWVTGGDAGDDLDGDGTDDRDRTNPHALGATAEVAATLWSDGGVDGGHHGWRLGVGAGYQLGLTELATSGPLVGVHLGRVITHPSLVSVALVARYDRALVEGEDYQLLTVGAEMGSPLRAEEDRGAWDPSFPYLFGAHLTLLGFNVDAGARGFVPPGVGLTAGLPLGSLLDLRVRAEALALPGEGDDGVISYSAAGGARLRLDDLWPVFVEALGGWAASFGTRPRDVGDGPFLEVGLGVHALDLGGVGRYPPVPDLGLELALRFRAGLSDDNQPLRAILLAVGIEYGSRAGALGGAVEPRRPCF